MSNIIYKDRVFTNTSCSDLNGKKYKKVSTCPHCGIGTDAILTKTASFNISSGLIATASYRCTSCDKTFHVSSIMLSNSDTFIPYSVYPNFQDQTFSEHIQTTSPRFVKLYNQAYKAEYDTNYELAGCGYRNALEVLIKDFAINILGENKEEVIKCKLFEVIGKYLSDVDMSTCADVVRILGNDNTHYERDYENIDFDVLKQYLDIFIKLIDVQIKMKKPPVSRKK